MRSNQKRTLRACLLTLILCASISLGTTYALFTATVNNEINDVSTGTVSADVARLSHGSYGSVGSGAIFSTSSWEPGFMDAQVLRITNDGSMALNYKLAFSLSASTKADAQQLLDSVDVYIAESDTSIITLPADTSGMRYLGTLGQVLESADPIAHGSLAEGEADYVSLALCLKLNCAPECLPHKSVTSLAVRLVATQASAQGI